MRSQESNGARDRHPTAMVRRNRWRDVRVADVPPAPSLPVSVVIPAYQADRTLPFTLAALAHQDYPQHLLEVIVVDDGNEPALTLPDERPEGTRTVRVDGPAWGRANACHAGALAADGTVLFFLDSDMLPFHDHVTSQLAWHHLLTDAVTMGHKLFVSSWQHVSLDQAIAAARTHRLPELFDPAATDAHWVEDVVDTTDQLHLAKADAFRVFVGATGAMRRSLYLAAGGMDTTLRLGEDTDLGFRLAQVGAVFVPDRGSSSWHLGPPTVLVRGEESRRWNRPHLANRMPYPRGLRRSPGRVWPVPLVRAVVQVGAAGYEVTRGCVDRLIASDEEDIHIDLVAPWGSLTEDRRNVLADPQGDLHLLREWYATEPRVRLLEHSDPDVFPSPFRLELPPTIGVGRGTVRRLLATAQRHELGVVRVLLPGHGPECAARLTRTAAVHRAMRHLGRDDDAALDDVWGLRWLDGSSLRVVDLRATDRPADGGHWTRDTSRLQQRLRRQNEQLRSLRQQVRARNASPSARLLAKLGRRPTGGTGRHPHGTSDSGESVTE